MSGNFNIKNLTRIGFLCNFKKYLWEKRICLSYFKTSNCQRITRQSRGKQSKESKDRQPPAEVPGVFLLLRPGETDL
jgi:hypothetical protein